MTNGHFMITLLRNSVMGRKEEWFSTSEYAYDIFLSFRGEDTRKSFTENLYGALVNAGFGTFIDNNGIERGEHIKSELIKAINHSRGSIIVLSENYANSSWCLDELMMIVANKKSKGHVILPIFYHVMPSQVGKQMGSFEEAFNRYEERFLKVEDEKKKAELMKKLKGWKLALTEVAQLAGMLLSPGGDYDKDDTRFIQKVIQVMEDRLSRAVLTGASTLVGINSRVDYINSWLQDTADDNGVLVISGVGGVGKTTISKFVFNLNSKNFQASSFLENVRGTSGKPNGFVLLQRQLLSDISQDGQRKIDNFDEGVVMIKDAICHKRVLIVFDDVDRIDQLDVILSIRDWFCAGSKVIITTREESLLKSQGVRKVHKVEPLNFVESLELFSQYAFGQDYPVETYENFAIRVINRCGGLPLALKLLGSSLFCKELDVWRSAVEKLEELPDGQILNVLKLSYDSLPDNHDKSLFLHISCFFVGKDKDHVVKILDGCDFHTMIGLQSLTDRCLITLDSKLNLLKMHPLVQVMGREIARQESPKKPEKRSRLWRSKDSFDVLRNNTGTEIIEGLALDMEILKCKSHVPSSYNARGQDTGDVSAIISEPDLVKCEYTASSFYTGIGSSASDAFILKTDAFNKMHRLQLLQLNYAQLAGRFTNFPKNLRWLSWHGFPLKSIPNAFPLEKIVALDLSNSRLVRFWKRSRVASYMKVLDLSHSHELRRTPHFSGLPNLEMLIFRDCVRLSEIHESIGSLKGLVLLDLKHCKTLNKLPETITMLKYLETLIISGCSNLREFPMQMEKMISLRVLEADGITKSHLLSTTSHVNSWYANVFLWKSKPRDNMHILWPSFPKSLNRLSLKNCGLSEDDFPTDLSNLILLQELDLSMNQLRSLPVFIVSLSSLWILTLDRCKSLQSLLALPEVSTLSVYRCKSLETITHVSTSFRIPHIHTADCKRLKEIQGFFKLEPMEKLSIQVLDDLGFSRFKPMTTAEVSLQDGITYSVQKRSTQLFYEFGIFSTSIPGIEVPEWFSCKKIGSSITFTIPIIPNLQTPNLNICFVYALCKNMHEEIWFPEHKLFIKVTNKTKNLKWIYYPTCFGIPDDDQDLLWLSHWTTKGQIENGNDLDLTIVTGDSFQIKECGVNFVYGNQELDILEKYLSWKEVIGGDLTAFQLSTGEYYLSRTNFLRYYRDEQLSAIWEDWTDTNWGKRLFNGPVDIRELRYRSWMGSYKRT